MNSMPNVSQLEEQQEEIALENLPCSPEVVLQVEPEVVLQVEPEVVLEVEPEVEPSSRPPTSQSELDATASSGSSPKRLNFTNMRTSLSYLMPGRFLFYRTYNPLCIALAGTLRAFRAGFGVFATGMSHCLFLLLYTVARIMGPPIRLLLPTSQSEPDATASSGSSPTRRMLINIRTRLSYLIPGRFLLYRMYNPLCIALAGTLRALRAGFGVFATGIIHCLFLLLYTVARIMGPSIRLLLPTSQSEPDAIASSGSSPTRRMLINIRTRLSYLIPGRFLLYRMYNALWDLCIALAGTLRAFFVRAGFGVFATRINHCLFLLLNTVARIMGLPVRFFRLIFQSEPDASYLSSARLLLDYIYIAILEQYDWTASSPPMFLLQAGLGATAPQISHGLLALLYTIAGIISPLSWYLVQLLGTQLTISTCHLVTAVLPALHSRGNLNTIRVGYCIYGLILSANVIARVSKVIRRKNRVVPMYEEPASESSSIPKLILRKMGETLRVLEDVGIVFGTAFIAFAVNFMESPISVHDDRLATRGSLSSKADIINSTTMTVQSLSSPYVIWMLWIWNAIAVTGFIVSLVSRIRAAWAKYKARMENAAAEEEETNISMLESMKMVYKDGKFLSIIPFAFFIGGQQMFIYMDFTDTYVGSTLGTSDNVMIGFLILSYLQYVIDMIISKILRRMKRITTIIATLYLHYGLLVFLLYWQPPPKRSWVLYTTCVVWSTCNTIWESLLNSLMLNLYKATWKIYMSSMLTFKWAGYTTLLSLYQPHPYVDKKLHIIQIMLITAMIPYLLLEYRLQRTGHEDPDIQQEEVEAAVVEGGEGGGGGASSSERVNVNQ